MNLVEQLAYQSHQKEKNLKAPSKSSDTGNVSIANSGHGDHEEVDTVPVGEALAVHKVGRVTRVLQLREVEDELEN